MAEQIKTWIEVSSDGKFGGTRAHVVISLGGNNEFRYEIPNVVEATWEASRQKGIRVTLVLQDVVMKTRVEIDSDKVKMGDLLAEIVASRLTHDNDDDPLRFTHQASSPPDTIHAKWCVLQCAFAADYERDCDCGATQAGSK